VYPLIIGFPINPAVISTGGIAPNANAGIPIHSIPDGGLPQIKYSKTVFVVRMAIIPVFAGTKPTVGNSIVPTGAALSIEFVDETQSAACEFFDD
jgi:hypothetical protein